jgi:hypothetical protein
LDGDILPESTIVAIGVDDPFLLGVVSSRVHVLWAEKVGTRLGVGNDPRYNNSACFDTFPFPLCSPGLHERIGDLAEKIDQHRKRQQDGRPDLTSTAMYNVLAKVRAGAPLTDKERLVHDEGLVTVLRQLHDELDAAVLDAYGWSRDIGEGQLLDQLVALNARRAKEERQGAVHWIRPEFQHPEGVHRQPSQAALLAPTGDEGVATAKGKGAWPMRLRERIGAVRAMLVGGLVAWTVEEVSQNFTRAKRADVEDVLNALTALGLAVSFEVDGVRRWRASGRRAA